MKSSKRQWGTRVHMFLPFLCHQGWTRAKSERKFNKLSLLLIDGTCYISGSEKTVCWIQTPTLNETANRISLQGLSVYLFHRGAATRWTMEELTIHDQLWSVVVFVSFFLFFCCVAQYQAIKTLIRSEWETVLDVFFSHLRVRERGYEVSLGSL